MANNKNDTSDTARGNTNSRARNWFFTFNNYDSEDIKKMTQLDCNFVFQEETGKNGTRHLQGCLFFKNARSFKSMKKIDEKIHWEVCMLPKKAAQYCCKTETRTGDVFTNIKTLKFKKTLIKEYREWQLELIEDMKKSTDRTVIWYWSDKGNVGKSTFARHWYRTKPNTIKLGGKAADMKHTLAEAFHDENIEYEYIFIDLVRSMEQYVSYQGIEEIKDGFFYSGKYKGKAVDYNDNPTIVIFANFPPDTSKLSSDRWIIKEIK